MFMSSQVITPTKAMQTNDELKALIDDLTKLKSKHFDAAIRWYQNHSKAPHVLL